MLKLDYTVLNRIQDDVSKDIYTARIAYNNGDLDAMEKIIETVRFGGRELIQFMKSNSENLYIFGAGILGNEFLQTWKGIYSFHGVIDNDDKKWGNVVGEGIPVIGLQDIEVAKREQAAIVIVNKFSHREIKEQLLQSGFSDEHIFNFAEHYLRLNQIQYFDLEILDKNKREKFVDCGALDGKTSMYMYEIYKENLEKIWLFEPDMQSARKCRENLKSMPSEKYEIIEKAVYSTATQLCFDSTGNGMASIDQNGNTVIDTVSLDEVIGEGSPSFIKMDIEGAELEALKGAEKIIRKYKPTLAVCVYHKPEDMVTIPELLLKYNPAYRFYLRHYSLTMNETVLYALQ